MSSEDIYDIAIIGAGPSGCASALALHGNGLRVVLVDKANFPRDKVCGDAIPGQAFKAMDIINPEWGIKMRNFLDKTEVISDLGFLPKNKPIPFKWTNYSYNSKRIHFDYFLLNLVRSESATTIIQDKQLQKVSIQNGMVHCDFQDGSSIQSSLIIGCDGANSVIKRQLSSLDFRDDTHSVAVRAYYRNIKDLQKGINEFHFLKECSPGYFWIFPLDNGWANVGFGMPSYKVQKNKNHLSLRKSLNTIITTNPKIVSRFKDAECMVSTRGFALPFGSNRKPISGERFLLCGDAASLIDPIGGHGIDNAMWSGFFAAEQAIRCFQTNNFDAGFMKGYDDAVYKKIGKSFSKGQLLLKLEIFYPLVFSLLALLMKNKKIGERFIRLLVG
jgi:geranylgeranyl reductase family protein